MDSSEVDAEAAAGDLERKLREFQTYYNAARCHASLKGHTPATFVGGQTKPLVSERGNAATIERLKTGHVR